MALPAGELDALRAAAAEALQMTGLTADIQRNQSTTFVLGQPTEDYQSILPGGTPIPCGMRKPSAALASQYAALIGTQRASVMSFAYGQDVQQEDHVVVSDGTTWTVHAALGPNSLAGFTQVLAARIS